MALKTKPVYNHFFPSNILALTSDNAVDFSIDPQNPSLNSIQKKYLNDAAGCPLPDPVSLFQEHGNKIHSVEKTGEVYVGDGLITSTPHCPLAMRSADCLPVFLTNESNDCIGLVHAGWNGTHKRIVVSAVKSFISQSSCRPEEIHVAFGPSICPQCYEVGEEFRGYFSENVNERDGAFYFDLAAQNKNQLLSVGVQEKNIQASGLCTHCGEGFFSYRREGDRAGRMISVIMINT